MAIHIQQPAPVITQKFCPRCGRKCVYSKKVMKYNKHTGMPVEHTLEQCPLVAHPWYGFLFKISVGNVDHRNEKYDEKGSHISGYWI